MGDNVTYKYQRICEWLHSMPEGKYDYIRFSSDSDSNDDGELRKSIGGPERKRPRFRVGSSTDSTGSFDTAENSEYARSVGRYLEAVCYGEKKLQVRSRSDPSGIARVERQESGSCGGISSVAEEYTRLYSTGMSNLPWYDVFNRGFLQQACRNFVLHDIYEGHHDGGDIRRLARVGETSYQGAVFIVSEHGGHFHVVHDCEYRGKQCRCARLQEIEAQYGRRRSRRVLRGNEFDVRYA